MERQSEKLARMELWKQTLQLTNRRFEIAPRLLLIFAMEPAGRIDLFPRKKVLQNLRTLRSKNDSRNPAVFLPNLGLIFQEAFLRLTENTEVHINDRRCVGVRTHFVTFCGHHELADPVSKSAWERRLSKTALRQRCAPLLIVAGPRVIDRVMKPECHFHRLRIAGQMPGAIQLSQTFGDVLLIVIVPMGFGVSRGQMSIPG